MFSLRDAWLLGLASLVFVLPAAAQDAPWSTIGRAATPAELAAWDIDVRPDFKGLPPGSGSVDDGQDLWESTCAVCHGIFGESNAVFTPIVGGTTGADVESGHTATLKREDYPGSTTFMKVATISTIWDYIHRAMPWDHPKSLSADQVYALTAYLLNLSEIVPDDFVLSDQNIAEVQARMPNRKGMTTEHAMWPGNEFGSGSVLPDVLAVACMKDCVPAPKVASEIPETERNTWGNLREQNRTVGPQRGADTSKPEGKLGDAAGPVNVVGPRGSGGDSAGAKAFALAQEHGCTGCHTMDKKLVGPSFKDVAKKYPGQAAHIVKALKSGSSGVWGDAPMPPQDLAAADLDAIAAWLSSGAKE